MFLHIENIVQRKKRRWKKKSGGVFYTIRPECCVTHPFPLQKKEKGQTSHSKQQHRQSLGINANNFCKLSLTVPRNMATSRSFLLISGGRTVPECGSPHPSCILHAIMFPSLGTQPPFSKIKMCFGAGLFLEAITKRW